MKRTFLISIILLVCLATISLYYFRATKVRCEKNKFEVYKDSLILVREVSKRVQICDSIMNSNESIDSIFEKPKTVWLIDSLSLIFSDTFPNMINVLMKNKVQSLIETKMSKEPTVRYHLEAFHEYLKNNCINTGPIVNGMGNILEMHTSISNYDFKNQVFCENYNFLVGRSFFSNKFRHTVAFGDSHFPRETMFYNDSFFRFLNLSNVYFGGIVSFDHEFFADNLLFNKCQFERNCYIQNSLFTEDLKFENSKIRGTLHFKNNNFNSSKVDFSNAVLPDTINFSSNHFNEEIDLTTASFTDSMHYDSVNDNYYKPHYISLSKTDITKLRLDYIHFRLITDSVYGNGFYRDKKLPKDDADGLYIALLNNFQSRGQMDSYQLLDIEYQEFKWKYSTFPFFVVFPKYWWNFGYSKGNIFIWTFIFLVLFTLISYRYLDYLNKVYTLEKIGNIDDLINSRSSFINLLRRLWLSFVYTAAIFFRLTLKVESIEYKKVPGTVYIFIVYSIGILCLAYMANYVIQK